MTLPTPVSANRYWRIFNGRPVLSSDARKYREWVAIKAREIRAQPLSGNVAVHVALCPELTKKGEASKTRLDLDNCLKVALDALQGIAFNNDKQIVKLVAELGPARIGGALMVEVTQA